MSFEVITLQMQGYDDLTHTCFGAFILLIFDQNINLYALYLIIHASPLQTFLIPYIHYYRISGFSLILSCKTLIQQPQTAINTFNNQAKSAARPPVSATHLQAQQTAYQNCFERYLDIIISMSSRAQFGQNQGFSLPLLVNSIAPFQVQPKIKLENYDALQLWMLQQCDRMQLLRSTKYLAKSYFDRVITQLPHLSLSNATLYLLTCILLAVKFNENRMISQRLSIQQLVDVTEGQFQHEDFVIAEQQILGLLCFRLHMLSPYEVSVNYDDILRRYPHRRARLAQIDTLVDFAIALPRLILLPAEEIFLACFFLIYEKVLLQSDRELIFRRVKDASLVDAIRKAIEQALREASEEQLTLQQ